MYIYECGRGDELVIKFESPTTYLRPLYHHLLNASKYKTRGFNFSLILGFFHLNVCVI